MINSNNNRYVKQLGSAPIASLAASQPAEAESKYLSFPVFLRKAKRAITYLGAVGLALFLLTAYAEPVASPYEIQLQSRKFTPKAGVPADLGARIKRMIDQTGPEKARAHIIVQLENPPEPADRERLAKQGLTLLNPLNKRVWYASVTASRAKAIDGIQGVRWADLIKPEDKLAKALHKDAPPLPYHLRPGNRIAYSVLFHKDVTADEVLALTKRIDVKLEDFDTKAFPVVRAVTVNVPRGGLVVLANADIVAWIEPGPALDENHNFLNAQPLSNVDNVQLAPFNLNGTGVTVGVWEFNSTIFAGHLDLTPRVFVQAGQSALNSNHAAHVAGTVGASGVNVPNAEGMAPNVNIASWDHTFDTNEMTNAATSAGNPGQPTPIQISNHSYGRVIGWNNFGTAFTNNQNLFGLYNNLSVNFDNVVFQTGLIVAKSGGNDRNDAPAAPVPGQPADCFQGGLAVAADCIGPRGTAKNIITVGAMNGAGAITVFSSYGPTDDGRIKPDLVAQGRSMLSLAANTNIASITMSGTSMSSPVVAGVAALVLQEANTRNIAMTPAAMKALLIQTAQDVQGIGQSTIGPDYATGWGIVDAEAAVNLLRQSALVQGTLNATGNASAWTRTFYVPAGLAEVHLTLVWDDPAGIPGGQILVNDLDLRLIAPDATQVTPWALNPANPGQAAARDGGNDAVNNVEQVSVLNPMAGTWTVQVSANAFNLPQAPQAFAVAGLLPQIPQWYFGGGFGLTNTEIETFDTLAPGGLDTDDSDSAWKLFAGRKFSPNFALEFGYADLGKYSQEDPTNNRTEFEATALFAELIGWLNVHTNVYLFGKAGLAFWDVDLEYTDFVTSSSDSDTGLDPIIGLGFEYRFPGSPWAIRAEWEQYQNVGEDVRTQQVPSATDIELNGQDINVFGVTVTYAF